MKTNQANNAHRDEGSGRAAENSMKREMERLAQEWDDALQRKQGGNPVESKRNRQEASLRVVGLMDYNGACLSWLPQALSRRMLMP